MSITVFPFAILTDEDPATFEVMRNPCARCGGKGSITIGEQLIDAGKSGGFHITYRMGHKQTCTNCGGSGTVTAGVWRRGVSLPPLITGKRRR